MIGKIDRARAFAAQAHEAVGQRRKYTGEPYIVHPAAVAKLVASVTDDEDMICAAWLHDVVEDTEVTLAELEATFGAQIAALVSDLTDVSTPQDGNRAARKRLDREHMTRASAKAKTVKLADLIDNLGSIARHDPGFAEIYMGEKRALLEVLQEGDRTLHGMATRIIEGYYTGR